MTTATVTVFMKFGVRGCYNAGGWEFRENWKVTDILYSEDLDYFLTESFWYNSLF